MKLSIFQPIFKKYNYKQKGRFFCKVKNDIFKVLRPRSGSSNGCILNASPTRCSKWERGYIVGEMN